MHGEFSEYQNRFANAALTRTDGILEVRLHTDDGPFVFGETAHRELGFLFDAIAHDPQNKVMILTGTGDRFCAAFDYSDFVKLFTERGMHDGMAQVGLDGRHMLESFINIEIPIISAINGPCLSHSEIPVLADVVLAADSCVFQDPTHFLSGVVPGDGMHTVWTTLLGLNRGRYFLMTGQKLGAIEAQRLGVVAEVMPQDRLLARARELAAVWAKLPLAVLRSSKRVMMYEWQRLIREQLAPGLAQETLGLLATPASDEGGPTFVDLMNMPSIAAGTSE